MKLISIIALAVIVATPAFAASGKKKVYRSHGYMQLQPDWRGSYSYYRGGGRYLRGPHVYSPSGRYVGSDPSPNVRQRMYDDDLRFREQF